MIDSFIILGGKILSVITKNLNLGNGSTWPGHIALKINSHFIIDILKKSKTKTIVVAGTNGKTTTSKLIATILESNNKKVLYNDSGANLLNGIASSLLLNSNNAGELQFDYALFEADENALPLILSDVKPDYGHAKNKRVDLKQMTLLLATTCASGFPVWMESHSGNSSDKKPTQPCSDAPSVIFITIETTASTITKPVGF